MSTLSQIMLYTNLCILSLGHQSRLHDTSLFGKASHWSSNFLTDALTNGVDFPKSVRVICSTNAGTEHMALLDMQNSCTYSVPLAKHGDQQ